MVSFRVVVDRLSSIPLPWLVATFTVAQLADLATASVIANELNPIAASVGSSPLPGFAVKASPRARTFALQRSNATARMIRASGIAGMRLRPLVRA